MSCISEKGVPPFMLAKWKHFACWVTTTSTGYVKLHRGTGYRIAKLIEFECVDFNTASPYDIYLCAVNDKVMNISANITLLDIPLYIVDDWCFHLQWLSQ